MPNEMNTTYEVGKGKVTLDITIGDGQFGSSLVHLGDTKLAVGHDVTNVKIGKGPDLVGKTLTIKSVVTDTNDKTMNLNVTYLLSGGPTRDKLRLHAVATAEGDSVIFRTTIQLTDNA